LFRCTPEHELIPPAVRQNVGFQTSEALEVTPLSSFDQHTKSYLDKELEEGFISKCIFTEPFHIISESSKNFRRKHCLGIGMCFFKAEACLKMGIVRS